MQLRASLFLPAAIRIEIKTRETNTSVQIFLFNIYKSDVGGPTRFLPARETDPNRSMFQLHFIPATSFYAEALTVR